MRHFAKGSFGDINRFAIFMWDCRVITGVTASRFILKLALLLMFSQIIHVFVSILFTLVPFLSFVSGVISVTTGAASCGLTRRCRSFGNCGDGWKNPNRFLLWNVFKFLLGH